MIKWLGIAILYLLPVGYIVLMPATQQTVEIFVVSFLFLMAIGMTLLATILKKYTNNNQENRKTAIKILKKASHTTIKNTLDE